MPCDAVQEGTTQVFVRSNQSVYASAALIVFWARPHVARVVPWQA